MEHAPQVPFLDVLSSMLDPSLPLTTPEWEEWGDPASDPATLSALLDFSPCHAVVRGGGYPAALVTAGGLDAR